MLPLQQANAAIIRRPHLHLVVMGQPGHGKQTLCDILFKNYGFRYSIGSLQYAMNIVYPRLRLKYNYKDEVQCWNDRRKHEEEWFNLIQEYNISYPLRSSNIIWTYAEVYSGLRDLNELRRIKAFKLLDLSLWIDASKRINDEKNPKSIMTVHPECAQEMIDNNGSYEELCKRVDDVMGSLGYVRKNEDHTNRPCTSW